MTDDQAKTAEAVSAASEGMDAASGSADGADAPDWSAWGNLWQVPAVVVSLILIGLGLYVAARHAPQDDFDGALDEVERFIAVGQLDTAKRQLQEVVEPNLHKASAVQEARFHAAVADWVAASQEASGTALRSNNQVIAEQYGKAVEMGLLLTAVRIERRGTALINLGRFDEARRCVSELEALGVTDGTGEEARMRRNRLLRRMVGLSLRQESLSYPDMMEVLAEYRDDRVLSPADQAWAVARQAELRLEAGDAQEAIDHLLLDMRRMEHGGGELDAATWGELYTLLARAYASRGCCDDAEYHAREALALFRGPEAARGDALLVLGGISVARGDVDAAFELYDEVVREYVETAAYLPALFSRAETQSIRGEHESSLEDYRLLTELLPRDEHRRELNRALVAGSLADRHDAALTIGELPLALRYVSLAEALFDPAEVPVSVLFRIASTSRQIADNMITDGLASLEQEGRPARLADVGPEIRHAAQVEYEKAGGYFVRHARAVAAAPDGDEDWAGSLWLAADSYDLAARRELAIKLLREYIAGRPVDDPRRAEVTFRLAKAHQAEMDFEEAAASYRQVIEEHPRSIYGTGSHVLLARCLLRLGRRQEAERELLDVVEDRYGQSTPITPDAVDYRNALIELGRLYYDGGDYKAAVERLTAAEERCADDRRINEIRFWLADSYRRRARELEDRAETQAALSPDERSSLRLLAREHRQAALDLFDRVCVAYAPVDERHLDRLQRDSLRYAWLYRGDCAYDMGQYELASKLYDKAARKYSGHYASMHALVQIYNCFYNLGDMKRAEVAHHNAMIRLRQLPEGAFDDPQAIMDRAAWERWLKNRPMAPLTQSSSVGASGSSP